MIRSVFFLMALMVVFLSHATKSPAQCDVVFEYKIDGSKISIKTNQPVTNIQIGLYDLRNQNMVKSKLLERMSDDNDWILIFEEVEKSSYVIVIKMGDCEKILGGLGISIDSNN